MLARRARGGGFVARYEKLIVSPGVIWAQHTASAARIDEINILQVWEERHSYAHRSYFQNALDQDASSSGLVERERDV